VPTETPSTALEKARPDARHKPRTGREVIVEAARIVFAVSISMALGVAIGLWINTKLASPPFDNPPTLAQSPPVAHDGEQTAPAYTTGEQPDESNLPSQRAAEDDRDEPPRADVESTPPDETAGDVKRADGADASTPNAHDEGARAKTDGGTPDVGAKLVNRREAGRGGPCGLSASANAITIRGGSSVSITIKLSGTNGPARVAASTPNWSDIAVFAESETSGNGVSVRWYTVRSVSGKPGVYRVSFTTPCGTKTIPVTVTQP
jgi:hypothetical protein